MKNEWLVIKIQKPTPKLQANPFLVVHPGLEMALDAGNPKPICNN